MIWLYILFNILVGIAIMVHRLISEMKSQNVNNVSELKEWDDEVGYTIFLAVLGGVFWFISIPALISMKIAENKMKRSDKNVQEHDRNNGQRSF